MLANQDALVTPFDLHATLRHVLTYPFSPLYSSLMPYEALGASSSHPGLSLFQNLPKRGCADVGLTGVLCPCMSWRDVPVTEPYWRRYGCQACVTHIQSYTYSLIRFRLAEYAVHALNALLNGEDERSEHAAAASPRCMHYSHGRVLSIARQLITDDLEKVRIQVQTHLSDSHGNTQIQQFSLVLEERRLFRQHPTETKGRAPQSIKGLLRVLTGAGLHAESNVPQVYLDHPHIINRHTDNPLLLEFWDYPEDTELLVDWVQPSGAIDHT